MNRSTSSSRKTTRRANGTGGIYRRKANGKEVGCWLIKYLAHGKVHYESSKSNIKKAAQDLLRKRQGEADRGELASGKVTFKELSALITGDYRRENRKSLVRLLQCLKHLEAAFGTLTADRINAAKVSDYCEQRAKAGARPATVANEIAALTRMFSLAYAYDLVPRRPKFPKPKADNVREGFFTEAELRTVATHLPEYMKPFVWFLFYTGWRRGEAVTLKWSQVDFESRTLRLPPGTTKNGRGRELPFGNVPQLEALINERREATEALERAGQIVPWVFFQANGDMIGDCRGSWQTACEKAKLAGRLLHDLRRSAVRNLIMAGVDEKTAMAISGHKTRSVFDRYHIVSGSDVAEAMAKVACRLGGIELGPRSQSR